MCIFCDENCDSGNLHEFRSLVVEQKAQESTKKLEDSLLLAKISGGDLLAIEAKYHIDSLTKFRNKYCLVKTKEESIDDDTMNEMLNESHAFVEPTTYRENSVDKGKLIFKLSELPSMYIVHLKDCDSKTNQ